MSVAVLITSISRTISLPLKGCRISTT